MYAGGAQLAGHVGVAAAGVSEGDRLLPHAHRRWGEQQAAAVRHAG